MDVILNSGAVPTYTNVAGFPTTAGDGSLAVAKATDSLYEFDATTQAWILIGPFTGGGGTVTSVALTAPVEFTVAGSPVTSTGTLAISKAVQTANQVWAGPSSGAATFPTFRPLVNADVPGVLPTNSEIVYVNSAQGSNSTGNGSMRFPWATIAFALTQITDSAASKPYFIQVPTFQNETSDALLKPYTFVVGYGMKSSTVAFSSSFCFRPAATLTGTAICGLKGLTVSGTSTFNMSLSTTGGTSGCLFILEECYLTGAMSYTGRSGTNDKIEVHNCLTTTLMSISSAWCQFYNVEFGANVTITNPFGVGLPNIISNVVFEGNFTTAMGGSWSNVAIIGTLTTTVGVSITSFRALPPTSRRSLFAGTTLTYSDNATAVPFTPTTSGNWTGTITDAQLALDALAASGIIKSQAANLVLASPTGSSGTPTFRALAFVDIPLRVEVQSFTLNGTNITNQYVDLTYAINYAPSVIVWVQGGPIQSLTTDYTVSLTGGVAGVGRVTFAGDLATGGASALVAGDVFVVHYTRG